MVSSSIALRRMALHIIKYGRWIYINGELMYEEARSDSNYYGGRVRGWKL